jgi:hypothetical protein
MAEKLRKAAFVRAIDTPKRRFRRLKLDRSSLSLQARVAAPSYWFERDDLIKKDGTFWRDSSRGVITLMVDGVPSVLFYLVSGRLDSCTFAYHLTPSQLGKALVAMRRAKLTRLIIPAARWALTHMPRPRRPVLEGSLRALMRAGG